MPQLLEAVTPDGRVWRHPIRIADMCGLSISTVRRTLDKLSAAPSPLVERIRIEHKVTGASGRTRTWRQTMYRRTIEDPSEWLLAVADRADGAGGAE